MAALAGATMAFPPATASAQSASAAGYVLEETVVHTLASAHVGDSFQVAVAPPLGPAGGQGPWPLVLMADADLAFAATAQIARMMQLRGELPPFLLAGVGYGDLRTALDTRARDLTPTVDPGRPMCGTGPGCGGSERFLAFLEEELLPFVAARYPVTEDRTYFGASLGGLFGAYALLGGSHAFRRYVLGSPTVAFDDHAVLGPPGPRAGDRGPGAAAVFVGVGGEEGPTVQDARRLVEALEARGVVREPVVLEVFEGERHMSVQPMVVARGLRVVFELAPAEVAGGR